MRNIALGMAAAVIIASSAFVGYQAVKGRAAAPLTQFSEQWQDVHCRACIPDNGVVNVDESYFFGAEGTAGSITLPPVVPCFSDNGGGCHSGFYFQYGIVMKWKGNKTAVPTLSTPGAVTTQTIYNFTIRRNGEWITCVDLTFDPPTEGTFPTLAVTGNATVNIVGVLRYRFPQYNDWCLAYQ